MAYIDNLYNIYAKKHIKLVNHQSIPKITEFFIYAL